MAEHCITCGDEALPCRWCEVDGRAASRCAPDEAGERETVEIALVDAVGAGRRLLVHAGTAIADLEREAAA